MVRSIRHSLEAALALGCLSALGDWVWARFLPDGSVWAGLVHGAIVFLALSLVVARGGGRGAAVGSAILLLPSGVLIAGSFYPLAAIAGYLPALVSTWVLMWLALAAVRLRLVVTSSSWGPVVLRGALAAVASGLTFWSVAWLWTGSGEATGLPARAALWSYAFLPGFLALFVVRAPQRARESTSQGGRDTLASPIPDQAPP